MDCVKKIGCFPSCNAIRFPYKALETGVHLLVYEWLGSKKSIVFEAVAGEYFYIPNNFNESSDPVFSIKQPSGTFLCWDSDLEQLVSCPSSLGTNCDYIMNFTLEVVPTTGVPDEPAYSDKIYNISSAFDNGDGTYTISVLNPKDGDMAVDDSGTFYEYQGGVWTIKFKEVCAFQDEDNLPSVGEECALYFQGGKYWKWDGSQYVDVTPTIDFNDIDGLPNLVRSVNAGTGISVDNTDPENPVVGLNAASQNSLAKANSAIQPGDDVSKLTNDSGYLTEATHDALPQDNPHGVTKAQVGLGNVDNTSDLNKPVSTAQAQAINQAEADAKQYTDDEINALNLGSASQSDVGDFATAAQGAKADTALQPGDNISQLVNDEGFVDSIGASAAAPVQSVNNKTGNVTIDPDDLDDSSTSHKFVSQSEKDDIASALQPGDNAFELNTQFQTLADAPLITWDVSQGEIAKVILGGNRTLANPTNLKAGRYDLIVEQDGVGDRLLYLDTNYRMPNGELVLSSGAGSQDKVSFISDGTLMYGAINKGYRYVPKGFVITVDTTKTGTSTNTQFTIPTSGSGYNYSVRNALTGANYLTGQTGDATVDFGASGVYDIEIVGDFPRIYFNNGGDKDKLIEIKQWGSIVWNSFTTAFYGCSNLMSASGYPILNNVGSLHSIFRECSSLTTIDVGDWDVSNITTFYFAFYNIPITALDVSNWDVSNVTDFTYAFSGTALTTLDVSNWNVSNATNLSNMFRNSTGLSDLPIQNWNIENVTTFTNFALGVTIPTATYDQILNNWAAQSVQPNKSPHFGNSKYSPVGQVGRDILINTHGWTITDAGPV